MKKLTIKIKKGKHNISLLTRFKMWFYCFFANDVIIKVNFTKATYNLNSSDQKDWNKLFGYSSFWPKIVKADSIKSHKTPYQLFGYAFVPGQHVNSKRIVWRYNVETNRFEISDQYIYVDCQRILPTKFVTVAPHKEYAANLILPKCRYFNLHPYFGGNRKAPIDIEFELTLIK